jgi:hypothetical protein
MLGGLIGYQLLCSQRKCAIVSAAELEHDRIVSGVGSVPTEPIQVSALPSSMLQDSGSLPNVPCKNLRAHCCGRVQLANLPEGRYVLYTCEGGAEKALTLMVVETGANPRASAYEDFLVARDPGHSVVSWHAPADGPLYMVVSKRSFEETLAAAKGIRRAQASQARALNP